MTSTPTGTVSRADWLDHAATLAPASVDMLYADPPYNTGGTKRGRAGSFADRFSSAAEHAEWLRVRVAAALPALKLTANILLHVDWRSSHRVRLMLDELLGEDRFVNHLVWSYGLGGSSPRRFARKHDDILFYCVDPKRYHFEPPMVPATSVLMKGKMKKATDVLDVPSINNMATERTGWPTQKPLALLGMLVRSCCPLGGVVYDPCCGSGTTLVAAAMAGRRMVGCDISMDAVRLARRRLKECKP